MAKLTELEYMLLYTLAKEADEQWVLCAYNNKEFCYEFDERIIPLAKYVCTCLDNIHDLNIVGPTPQALESLAGLVGRLTKPETPELNKRLWQHLHEIQEEQTKNTGGTITWDNIIEQQF